MSTPCSLLYTWSEYGPGTAFMYHGLARFFSFGGPIAVYARDGWSCWWRVEEIVDFIDNLHPAGRNSRCSSGVLLAGGVGAERDRVVGDLVLITQYGFAALQTAEDSVERCGAPRRLVAKL